MLADQYLWDNSFPGYGIDNNKIQNVGRAVIHQYKSPYAIESTNINNIPDKLNRLTHCQKCNNIFKQPITLTCGYTLCLNCLPSSKSQCLSFSCLRTHNNLQEELKPTILIENILSINFNNNSEIKSLLDCSICLSTLVEPITTQCGHTFCKNCLINTMTNMNTRSCPFCRSTLSRIGKVNKLINDWKDYIFNNTIINQKLNSQYIPIIQVDSSITFPNQQCLIKITQDKLSLLNYMSNNPLLKHYAICIFSKQNSSEFFKYGIMLQIHGIECVPDIRHSVVQATGLFRLRINQLTLDTDGCYQGDITRLDDKQDNNMMENDQRWNTTTTTTTTTTTIPTQVIKTQSTPTRKIIRPRPCSMRLSNSLPNNYPYSVTDSCPGSVNRKVWANGFMKPISPPITHSTLKNNKPPQQQWIDNSLTIHDLFYTRLHPYIIQYTSNYAMQYEWYLQQGDNLDLIIWWASNILPLPFDEKISLLGTDNLRGRIIILILWFQKCRSL